MKIHIHLRSHTRDVADPFKTRISECERKEAVCRSKADQYKKKQAGNFFRVAEVAVESAQYHENAAHRNLTE